MEWDDSVATALPKATGISWCFASGVKCMLSWPGLARSIERPYPLIPRGEAYPIT